jgi:hypothetical protein
MVWSMTQMKGFGPVVCMQMVHGSLKYIQKINVDLLLHQQVGQ